MDANRLAFSQNNRLAWKTVQGGFRNTPKLCFIVASRSLDHSHVSSHIVVSLPIL